MTNKALSAVHSGEILLEDFIKPMGPSRYRAAKVRRELLQQDTFSYGCIFDLY